jgi:hypothetical protein
MRNPPIALLLPAPSTSPSLAAFNPHAPHPPPSPSPPPPPPHRPRSTLLLLSDQLHCSSQTYHIGFFLKDVENFLTKNLPTTQYSHGTKALLPTPSISTWILMSAFHLRLLLVEEEARFSHSTAASCLLPPAEHSFRICAFCSFH